MTSELRTDHSPSESAKISEHQAGPPPAASLESGTTYFVAFSTTLRITKCRKRIGLLMEASPRATYAIPER